MIRIRPSSSLPLVLALAAIAGVAPIRRCCSTVTVASDVIRLGDLFDRCRQPCAAMLLPRRRRRHAHHLQRRLARRDRARASTRPGRRAPPTTRPRSCARAAPSAPTPSSHQLMREIAASQPVDGCRAAARQSRPAPRRSRQCARYARDRRAFRRSAQPAGSRPSSRRPAGDPAAARQRVTGRLIYRDRACRCSTIRWRPARPSPPAISKRSRCGATASDQDVGDRSRATHRQDAAPPAARGGAGAARRRRSGRCWCIAAISSPSCSRRRAFSSPRKARRSRTAPRTRWCGWRTRNRTA